MVYKKFRVQVVLRILLMVFTLLLIFALYHEPAYRISTLILSVLFIAQVIFLIRYTEQTNRKLARFFSSIRNADFMGSFMDESPGKSFDELNRELNEVIEAFKRTKTEKEENFNYLLTVIQHVSIGVLVYSRSGKVDVYNNAVKSLLQVKHLRHIHQLSPVSEELSKTLLEARAGEKKLVKVFVGNELLQLSIHATEFLMHGEKYLLVSLQDIHPELEQKEVESWQKLIRVLTHEIMNSITPISSLASTVQDILQEFQKEKESFTEEEKEDLENMASALATIERRSKGLLNFVELYRNLTRIPKPNFRFFPVADLFQRALELLEPKLTKYDIQINTRIFPGDLKLLADPDLVDQVLINLLLNAIDAVKDSEVRQISLTASVNLNNRTLIEVADTGIGISREALDKIFMPFFTSKKNGSGIGLSLSRQIMQMHKGSLSVRSAPGKGATFILVF
ncbi:GHKL domain-containing protein [Candidatus Sulfidibacterium hydrothermale]|uniref:sensor histidine kinase n=1 Tax=Candidatus Sulfidibacterium hydrothermale TaxID=2875962 RepID=UPI001F0A1ED9|nr:ATP-binding protein [Candidatus Sulfidibacterium hydrothermale]UBM63397.1 GHKL domain-containing protein [Candidatus Sulfidibacterium hydrothermale]